MVTGTAGRPLAGPEPIVRTETAEDHAAIRHVNEAAFGTGEEADLVEALREEGVVLLSAVAIVDDEIVGHVLFSRMSIDTAAGSVDAVALAPVAVIPARQRQGIGGQLIRYGLDGLREAGERIVIVVGHAAYYPRFGFSSERGRPLGNPFPPDAFMALELVPGALDGVRGWVQYPRAFRL
jgi:putative acetyltransferase